MRSQLDGGKDGRRSVRTTDNSQRSCFTGCKSHQDSYQQHSKDTQLSGSSEYRQTQIAKHRSEVRQGPHSHKNDRGKEPCLYKHIIHKVHQSQFMSNIMERHLPDILHYSVHQDHAILVSLYHSHSSAGEVSQQHSKGNRHQ